MVNYCVSLQDINHFFGKQKVLHNINLDIPPGMIYGILGPSGCGKTTTVKIITGILEATTGTVDVLGERMPKLSLMQRIGYMAQSDALYPLLTADENLVFFGRLYGMTKRQIDIKTHEVLSLVDLQDHRDKLVTHYSGGMKRRLSLALSLLHNPQILVLDEPTTGIDPILRKNIWDAMKELTLQGISIIVTTHVMDEAEKCQELVMLRDGVIIAQGTPEQLQKDIGVDSIEAAFIYYGGKG